MSTRRTVLDVEEYRDELLEHLLAGSGALPGTEEVALVDGLGRVLARDVSSSGDVPAFDNSAMDGYAVRQADVQTLPATLRVVADVPAGSRRDPVLAGGDCVRIMTGAPMPSDADTVVPVELTDGGAETVTITEAPGAGRHVRAAGGDLAAGDVVVPAGTTLTPGHLSAIAAAGAPSVLVRRRPVVAVVTTGDELVAPGGTLRRGQIYESNGTHLVASLIDMGVSTRHVAAVADDVTTFGAALDELADCDLVLLTGGVSVGAFDVSRIALEESGEGVFRHVRMQPGKPQGWGRWRGRTPVLAFPGNPMSTAISFEVFGRPVLDRLLGRQLRPGPDAAVAATGWRSPSGRRQYLPVRLNSDESGRLVATPAHRRGSASHMVTSLAGADALAVVAADVDEVAPGDVVTIRRLG
ncbi:molybdopterin molybdotransferase MoeA [Janibacter corallicola]|uniref:molybdopterin molybdotransferase MoeA n=1 Tax=Janibacter corallicola TaxID=415212 RepID=UPI000831013D|nr:gephyrin-like molybdotransferase Glp [Janibacter corallicola]